MVVLNRANAHPAFSPGISVLTLCSGPQNSSAPCCRRDGIGLNASFRDLPKKVQQAVVLFFMLMSSSRSDMKIKVIPMAAFFEGLGAVRSQAAKEMGLLSTQHPTTLLS